MKIKAIFVGRLQDRYLKEGIETYRDRISRYIPMELVEVEDESVTAKAEHKKIKSKEAERILKKVARGSMLVALDEKGKGLSSEALAGFIQKAMDAGTKELFFAVGGSLGLGEKVKERADLTLSLSDMTFTHQMVRVILLEQLYRAFTIIKGEPYHK
ncbi:MAG: 23S rRNA (pseudouridine(1915)-N(3))-methyltransferase RlmH [Deltaproteobacteria bacterium]